MKRPRSWRTYFALGLALPALTVAVSARAAEKESSPPHAPLPGSDGVYGRFDGRLELALAAGGEIEAGHGRASLRLSAHYLSTAGAYVRYADAFAAHDDFSRRLVSIGIDLKPLFLPRFARDYERGPATLDLLLDSISLNAGAYFAGRRTSGSERERGFEAGLGLGLPLCGHVRGLWLEARGERRFADHGASDWVVSAYLSWHAFTWTTDSEP